MSNAPRSPSPPPLAVENLSFRYRARSEPALSDISFSLQAGEVMLVAGASGSGKTTLIRCINGLIPRSYKGDLEGRVLLHGEDPSRYSLAGLSQIVGTVMQDPERQILGAHVKSEVAFGPENLGLSTDEVFGRVDEALARLGLSHLRDRETFSLSGGEKQKVALAGVLAMRPSILLLDEPLSSLDPASAREALEAFRRLADSGTSILLIEHRVEDALAARPERVLYLKDRRILYLGPPSGLGEVVDWREVKLPAQQVIRQIRAGKAEGRKEAIPSTHGSIPTGESISSKPDAQPEPLIRFENVSFQYPDGPPVLQGINLEIRSGERLALLGPNGAGKSTLVKHAIGLLKPRSGRVLVEGRDTRELSVAQVARTLGYVFQSPTHMLFAPTVKEELAFGPRNLGHPEADVTRDSAEAVRALNLAGLEDFPPLALSFGQQKRVTIACVVAMRSRILALDEPTAGQDFGNYVAFMDALLGQQGNHQQALAEGSAAAPAGRQTPAAPAGRQTPAAPADGGEGEPGPPIARFDAVIFITHDLDLAVTYASRVVLMAEGAVAADGPPEEVLRDRALLERCRIVPTSLLAENLRLLPKTGRFRRVEGLAEVQE